MYPARNILRLPSQQGSQQYAGAKYTHLSMHLGIHALSAEALLSTLTWLLDDSELLNQSKIGRVFASGQADYISNIFDIT
jgi:hypothetical protein